MICYEHQMLRHCQHMDHGSATTKLLCEIWFMGNQFYTLLYIYMCIYTYIYVYIYILYIVI